MDQSNQSQPLKPDPLDTENRVRIYRAVCEAIHGEQPRHALPALGMAITDACAGCGMTPEQLEVVMEVAWRVTKENPPIFKMGALEALAEEPFTVPGNDTIN